MNLIKILASILVALLVVLAVALFVGYSSLSSLTGLAIETVGPEVTKTRVQVERVEVDLPKGLGLLQGMTVDNPPGFSDEPALYLELVYAQLDTATLAEPVILVNELLVSGARVRYEAGDNGNNLAQLLANVETVPEIEVYLPSTAGPDLRFRIARVLFTDMTLEAGGETWALTDFERQDLGEAALGSAQLTRELLRPILVQALEQLTQ